MRSRLVGEALHTASRRQRGVTHCVTYFYNRRPQPAYCYSDTHFAAPQLLCDVY